MLMSSVGYVQMRDEEEEGKIGIKHTHDTVYSCLLECLKDIMEPSMLAIHRAHDFLARLGLACLAPLA
jgi:hypothetical protein